MPGAEAALSTQPPAFAEKDNPALFPEALSVAQITLSHFRNYHSLRLVCAPAPIILTGANGSGKTNLIEAISLLVPGRGLRRSALSDLQNHRASDVWGIAAELRTDAGSLLIGTGGDKAASGADVTGESERRLVHIGGRPARSQNVLAEYVAMAWITPDMDRLLVEGPSARRKFLDRLVFSFDPAHNARVQRYEKAMRERLRLLREGGAAAGWLAGLENEMAQTAVAIAAARRHMIERLRLAIDAGGDVFPRANIEVRGTAEDMLDLHPALLVEDSLRAAYLRARSDDGASGTCATGAHRSDLYVVHRAKNCPAALCSTGEQKALLIALMLAYVRLLSKQRDMVPLFLLDDIAAHLDEKRRVALFEEIRALRTQAWLTGTAAEDFAPLAPFAQSFQIENGAIYG